MAKLLKKNTVPKSVLEWESEAKAKVPDHDKAWVPPEAAEIVEDRQDLERYAGFNFWKALNKAELFKELLNALPGFWEEPMQNTTKKKVLADLEQYLQKIRSIAAKEMPNDFHPSWEEPIDMSRLDWFQILEIFI